MTNKLYRVYLKKNQNEKLEFVIQERPDFKEKKVTWQKPEWTIRKSDLGHIVGSSSPFDISFSTFCLEEDISIIQIKMMQMMREKIDIARKKLSEMIGFESGVDSGIPIVECIYDIGEDIRRNNFVL
jgi:hypothetical protein